MLALFQRSYICRTLLIGLIVCSSRAAGISQEQPETLAPPTVRTHQTRPIALEEARESAYHNNPAIAEAAARVEALRGKWLQVGLMPNPRIGYSGQQLGSSGLAEQHGFYLEQEFVRGRKLAINRHIIDHEIEQAEQIWSAALMRAQTDVSIEFYSALVAQQRVELTTELVELANSAMATTQARLEAKEGNRSDVLQARIEANQAKTLLQRSQFELGAARRRLHAVMGREAIDNRPLEGTIESDLPDLLWEDTLGRLLAESPEMAAASSGIDVAGVTLQRAQVEAITNVEIQTILQDDRGTGQMNGAILATLPLPLWNRNQGSIQQANSELVAAERILLRREQDLRWRLSSVFQRYHSARNQVNTFRQFLLPDATENLALVRDGYRAGEFAYLQLLTAQRTFVEASLTNFAAIEEAQVAMSEINGLLLRGSLSDR